MLSCIHATHLETRTMRTRVVGLSFGALTLATACATTTATRSTTALEMDDVPRPAATATTLRGTLDSMYAQSIADREGPRVDIRAQVTQFTGSRRVRAVFNVVDNAYVMIGHVDGTGVLRIVFPTDPHDDGFVQGGG